MELLTIASRSGSVREHMSIKPSRAEIAIAVIHEQRQELGVIVQSAIDAADAATGQEALSRWKLRTVKLLNEKVNDNESRTLAGKYQTAFRMADPFGNLIREAGIYDSFLSALSLELAAHPAAVFAVAEAPKTVLANTTRSVDPRSVFIVHGHDEAAKFEVARFLAKIGCVVTILHEQPSAGRTIIEKLEHNAAVAFVVALLTPDDFGGAEGKPAQPRARQNVILELGYFIGKLGRDRVCALVRHEVERPSDFAGVVWVPFDSGAWKHTLMQEMKEAKVKFNAAAAFS